MVRCVVTHDCATELMGVDSKRKGHHMALVAIHILDILDMVHAMTTNQHRESVAVACLAEALPMSYRKLIRYLDVLTQQGKVEWCDEAGQTTVKLSPDGYITLQDLYDAQRTWRAIARNGEEPQTHAMVLTNERTIR